MLSLRSRHHKVVQSSHQILINSSHNLLFFRLPRTIISYSSACIIFRFREGMRPRVHLHRTDLVDPMLVAPTLGTYPIQTFHHIPRPSLPKRLDHSKYCVPKSITSLHPCLSRSQVFSCTKPSDRLLSARVVSKKIVRAVSLSHGSVCFPFSFGHQTKFHTSIRHHGLQSVFMSYHGFDLPTTAWVAANSPAQLCVSPRGFRRLDLCGRCSGLI